ncbi:hypothetical protein BPNPMPFG_003686 [Mesorhizobium sp. AR07]|nr:hypothetical protein BPNPMPFG_003686 [Mesorhizobium sp. AR07]
MPYVVKRYKHIDYANLNLIALKPFALPTCAGAAPAGPHAEGKLVMFLAIDGVRS